MLKCHEVSHLAASGGIARAGLLKRLEFRLHLMMCRHCRNYVRQVARIGAAAAKLFGAGTEDADAVARVEARVLASVRKPPPDHDGGASHSH